ncbi:MAG: 50S ribosome-binding GTPase [Desulfurococcales archaeon]|nr:50S ribosome-binding GTPase [Desulfurococcales archaeon]
MVEKECLEEVLRKLKVPEFQELRRRILRKFREPVALPKSVKKRGMVKSIVRVDKIYSIVNSELEKLIKTLPRESDLKPYHLEILKLASIEDYKDIVGKIRGMQAVLRRLWREYRLKIKSSVDSAEAKRMSREFVGRVMSVLRRLRHDFDRLNTAVRELSKLPCIEADAPRIVVAGMPQVGKSTFVRLISTARPEVSPFPFTTKDIILGHLHIGFSRIQVIDTPGILDRPLSKLNPVERKAVMALKYLADLVLFLIDPYEGAYYSLSQQLNLLKSVVEMFKGKEVIVVINKIDLVSDDRLREVEGRIAEVYKGRILRMSALKKQFVEEVLREVVKKLGFSENCLKSLSV